MWEKGQDSKAERQKQEEQSFGFGEEAKEERGEFGNIAGSPDGAAREVEQQKVKTQSTKAKTLEVNST